jgi:hypothetical protein
MQPRTLLLLLLLVALGEGELFQSNLFDPNSWKYIARFCFTTGSQDVPSSAVGGAQREWPQTNAEEPTLQYEVHYPKGAKVSLALYYDTFESWQAVAQSTMDCNDRLKQAQYVLRLWEPSAINDVVANSTSLFVSPRDVLKASGYANMVTSRSRWFFAVLAHCDPECSGGYCQGPINVHYKVNMLNGMGFFKHFGANEVGLFEAMCIFLVLQIGIFYYSFAVRRDLLLKNKYHHTVKLLYASVWLQLIAVVSEVVYWRQFSINGSRVEVEFAGAVAQGAFGLAHMLVLLQLVLVAKGWTIVRKKITASGRVKIASYMTAYFVVYWSMYLWESGIPHIDRVYIYDTAPGQVLIAIRVFGAAWVAYSGYTSIRQFRKKRRFYFKFVLAAVLWMLAIPIVYRVNLGVASYARKQVADIFDRAHMFTIQMVLLMLYDPSLSICGNTNSAFPFHANTSQMLGIRKDKTDDEPDNGRGLQQPKQGASKAFDGSRLGILAAMQRQTRMVGVWIDDLQEVLQALVAQDHEQDWDYDDSGQPRNIRGGPDEPREFNPSSFGSDSAGGR